MSDRPILIISGTNRPDSNAMRIARILAGHYAAASVPAELLSLTELPREVFDPTCYAVKPPGMVALQQRVLDALGLHIVTPEYNGSFPGVLKYFIDMLKFPDSFNQKPVAFTGEAAGIWGGIRAVEQLQMIFGYRNAYVFPERVFLPRINSLLDANGRLNDPELVERLREQQKGFMDFVKKLKG